MRIAIDATSLLLCSAGVKNYVHYWLVSLLDAIGGNGDSIVTYPPGTEAAEVIDHQHIPAGSKLRLRLVQACNIRGNPLITLLLSGNDLFHASQHTVNLPKATRNTATVFDLSCWTTPESHTPANIAATRRYAEKVLKRCDGLIAISHSARDDAAEILGIPEERIRVIYPGVAMPFFEAGEREAAAVCAKYGLEAPYLLFVGCIEPRKNVDAIMRAYRLMPESVRRHALLVIAGPMGWAGNKSLEQLASGPEGVRYLGYVPESDLPGLFRGSAALVYPSYYEGFGLPAAQAMATGIPVITSNRSCLPEVTGDAGLLVDPASDEALSDAMRRILESPDLARQFAARGRERANAFRWPACARQSLDFFHDVAGR